MTYLQQALAERRAQRREQEDYAVSAGGPASTLTVQDSSGQAWVFLWSTLVSAWYDDTEGGEVVVLTFLRHLVRIEGQNLDRIVSVIGELRLQELRAQPGADDYAERSETGKTVVGKVSVQLGFEAADDHRMGTR